MAADIHALEIEFAKNPTLEACIPLCEAYMAQKRFMEAMVVCKKGIKQAPMDARGRVMLARIYAVQGKGPKAQAELEQLMADMPGNPLGLEALGRVMLEQGRRDEGVAMLQQALASDPSRNDARVILQQMGMPVPQMAMPQPQAPMMAPPGARPPPVQQPMPGAQGFGGQPGFGGYGAPGQGGFGAPPAAMPPQARPGAPSPFQPAGFGSPPQQAPMMAPQAAPAAAAPAEAPQKMEHVHDFFAPETLGFSNEGTGDIETAGPGRLTILGFVPKNTGSIKTTLFVALGVLAVAAAVITYQYRSSVRTRDINKKYGELKSAMDEDKLGRYQDAIKRGTDILAIDDEHNLTLGALAYAHAVLAVDFKQPDALAKAKQYLQRAAKSSSDETEYRVAARALIAYADKQYDQGIADIKKIIDKGGSSPLVELEAFRLLAEGKPGDKDTQVELRRLTAAITSQARAFNFLGWYYYLQDDFASADKNFGSALQNVRGHPRALIGQAMTDFDRGIGLSERQKEIAKSISTVLSLPPEDLDPQVLGLAHFASGQLLQWQGKQAEADAEFDKAFKADAQNPILFYRRGTALLGLGRPADAVDYLRKAAAAAPNNVRFYRALCDAQIKSGDLSGAKATLERATQLAPTDPYLKVLEGDRLRADKDYTRAVEAYKLVKKEDGGAVFAHAMVGVSKALREGGKKPDAIKHIEDTMAALPADVMQPEQAELWCELGVDYEADKNKEAAQKWFEQGISTYQYYAPCHYFLCRLIGRGDEAKEACKRYLAVAPRGEFADDARKRAGVK